MAIRGHIDFDQIRPIHGTGSLVQLFTGTSTTSHVAIYDASGNLIDGGQAIPSGITFETNGVTNSSQTLLDLSAGTNITLSEASGTVTINASGGGGGGGVPWLAITNPTLTTFAWRNQGGATVTTNSDSYYLSSPGTSGSNIRGQEIAAPATPVSFTAGFVPHIFGNNNQGYGIYVTDGTKLVTSFVAYASSVATIAFLGINQQNSVTSWSSGPYKEALPGLIACPLFLKVFDNGTNLAFSWSPDGISFQQFYSQARTSWLASVSDFGWWVDTDGSTLPAATLLVSWVKRSS